LDISEEVYVKSVQAIAGQPENKKLLEQIEFDIREKNET
jgi:hypothetical protein